MLASYLLREMSHDHHEETHVKEMYVYNTILILEDY